MVLIHRLSDFLVQTEEAMKTIEYMEVLNNEDILKKICSKLPNFAIPRWCRCANEILTKGNMVKFHDFVEFVKAEAEFATNPVFSPYAIKEERKGDKKYETREQNSRNWRRNENSSSFRTQLGSQTPKGGVKTFVMRKCILCIQNHPLASCQKFKKMKLKDWIDFVRKKELCFGCLGMEYS